MGFRVIWVCLSVSLGNVAVTLHSGQFSANPRGADPQRTPGLGGEHPREDMNVENGMAWLRFQ